MLCFDVDGETTALSEDPALRHRLTTFSQCQYGPEAGVPRLLGLLEHLSVPATFFIPSYVAEHHPQMTQAIIDKGFEIGAHGHLHEKLAGLTLEQEAEILDASLEIFREGFGIVPKGQRAPWFEINPWTPDLLLDYGCCFTLTLPPWMSGRPSRVKLLERMLNDILATGDAWLATGSEIAGWFKANPNARRTIDLDAE
jgi:peptidoglycan-N-acetylglucosamine deacetylase